MLKTSELFRKVVNLLVMGGILLSFIQCSNLGTSISNEDQVKIQILEFSQLGMEDIEGEMKILGYAKKEDGNALIYPAEMDKDYYKFFPSAPGKFIIAYIDRDKYEDFFTSIEEHKVKQSAKGCPEGKVYQLGQNCYVCKTWFKIDFQRYILSVSTNLNFSLPSVLPHKPTPIPKKPTDPNAVNGQPKYEPNIEDKYKRLHRDLGGDRQQGNPPIRQANPRQPNNAPQNPVPSKPRARGGDSST